MEKKRMQDEEKAKLAIATPLVIVPRKRGIDR